MKKTTICILNYKSKDVIFDCIDSLINFHHIDDKVIYVVDNASNDGSLELLKEKYPFIYFIENSENLGFSKGNNQVIRETDTEYFLMLNPDVIFIQNTIEKMIEEIEKDKLLSIVSTKLVYPNGTTQKSIDRFPSLNDSFIRFLRRLKVNPRFIDKYGVENFDYNSDHVLKDSYSMGSLLLIRADLLIELGGFDEVFSPMYLEETDLSSRLQKEKYNIKYCADISAIHHHSFSFKLLPLREQNNINNTKEKNRLYYIKKHYNNLYYCLFILLRFFEHIFFIIYYSVKYLINRRGKDNLTQEIKFLSLLFERK